MANIKTLCDLSIKSKHSSRHPISCDCSVDATIAIIRTISFTPEEHFEKKSY